MKHLKKVLSALMVAVILSLSVGSSYFGACSVHATEWVVAGGVGAEAALDFLLAFWASLGVGKVAYDNRSELWDSYCDYMNIKIQNNELAISSTQDTALQLYDSTTKSFQNIPWQDLLDSFSDGFDSVIDGAYDLYAKYCPALIGLSKDYVSDVLDGAIYVKGISDSFVDGISDVTDQWSGEGYEYMCDITYYWDYYSCWDNFKAYTTAGSNNPPHLGCLRAYPVALAYLFDANASVYRLYILNGNNSSVRAGGLLFSTFKDGVLTSNNFYINNNYSSVVSSKPISVATNIPIFGSKEAAEEYLSGAVELVSSALNYVGDVYDHITDNVDLPPFYRTWQQELWEKVASAPDVGLGIGSYGAGVGVYDDAWADDIPWVGVGDLVGYGDAVQDVYDKSIDDVICGVYDPAADIPDSYADAWERALDDTWPDVLDPSLPHPGVDTDDPDVPLNPDIDVPLEDEIDISSVVPGVVDDFSGFSIDLKDKFPFCIPWDIYYLLSGLSDAPKTPVFKIPLVISSLGIHEELVMDMTPFEGVSRLSRALLSLFFAFGLIRLTIQFVDMINDNVNS